MVDNKTLLDLGMNIVDRVSDAIIKTSKEKSLGTEIGTAGAGGDLTKFADELSEKIVKETVNKFTKRHSDVGIILITEETGIIQLTDKKEGIFLILDPLDGSNNLRPWLTPSPFVSISLAIGYISSVENSINFDAVEIGIVKDIFNKRTYYAEKGKGSFVLDFGQIKPSPLDDVEKAIIGIDFDIQQSKYQKLSIKVNKLMKDKKCFRRLGSSILDFMKVACGEYETFVSLGSRLKIHDVAAAQLIVKESGGIFEFIENNSEKLLQKMLESNDSSLIEANKFRVIASGNQKIHNKVFDLIKN